MNRRVIAIVGALLTIMPVTWSNAFDLPPQTTPGQTAQQQTEAVEAGEELYRVNCRRCHGAEGQGNAAIYKAMGTRVIHLGSKEAQDKTDDFIRKTMTDGFGKMGAMTRLTAEDIDKIVAFVRTLKQGT